MTDLKLGRQTQAVLLTMSGLLIACATAAFAATWQPQGPGPTTNGQVEGIADREVVGAIQTVAPHPTDADILYAGGVNGGIWKTTTATAEDPDWVFQSQDHLSLSVSSIEFDPLDSSYQTLVAGFGRFSSFRRTGGERIGVMRTTDGGASWSLVDGDGSIAGINISAVVARGATLLFSADDAGIDSGVYRSTDTGNTWSQISIGDGSSFTGLPDGIAFDLVGDRGTPTRLFTAIVGAEENGGLNGVYRSLNTGASWAKVSDAAMDALLDTSTTNNLEIAVGTSNNVYVGIVNGGVLAGIFRSGDGGDSWTAMDLPSDDFSGIHPGGQGSIHFSLAADLSDANIVYIGGDRQSFPNSIGANDFSGRLFRGDASASADNQWVHLTHRGDLPPAGGGTASISAPHADSRDMEMDAAGNLIESDDGGIYKRTSPQDNTGDWFSINGNIQTTEFHDAAYDENSEISTGGAQDNGSGSQITSGGLRWRNVSNADGGDVAIDAISTPGFSTRYTSVQALFGFRRQVFDASNELQSLAFPNLIVLNGGDALQRHFVTPVVLNAVTPTRLVIGGRNAVYESFDQGDTITQQTPSFSVNGTVSQALAYGVPGNPELIYAGSESDVWIRSDPPPAVFRQATTYPGTETVNDIVIDPSEPLTAYVVDSNTVYQTTDLGSTWTEVGGVLSSLEPGTLWSIEYLERLEEDALAVGTNVGVFVARESDGFAIWETLGDSLPRVPVFDLDYSKVDDLLVAGTLGNGAWKISPPLESVNGLFADGFESGDTTAWSSSTGGSLASTSSSTQESSSN